LLNKPGSKCHGGRDPFGAAFALGPPRGMAPARRLLYVSNMVSPGRHPRNPVARALDAAKDAGFEVIEIHKGHRWGKVACPTCGEDQGIWSSPKDDDNHAKQITRFVTRHRNHH
jgi:hypothetical protein